MISGPELPEESAGGVDCFVPKNPDGEDLAWEVNRESAEP